MSADHKKTIWKPKPLRSIAAFAEKRIIPGGSLARNRHEVTDAAAVAIGKDVIETCEILNSIFKKMHIHCRLDWRRLQHRLRNPDVQWKRSCERVVSKKFKGTLCLEQLLTVATVVVRYFDSDEDDLQNVQDILIWGPCQGTKTIVFSFLFILLPTLEKLFKGRVCVPIINTPNYTNLALSSRKELETTFNLYADIDIVDTNCKENVVSMSFVQTEIIDKMLTTSKGIKDWSSLVLQRNAENLANFLDSAAKNEKECITINFIDEVHYGSASKGVIDTWETQFRVMNPSVRMRRLGITATPSEVWGLDRWILIPMWVMKNYMGITKYNGRQLPTISGKTPPMQEFAAIEDAFPELSKFMDRSLLDDIGEFCKLKKDKEIFELTEDELKDLRKEHDDFWWKFATVIFDIYKKSVTNEFPIFFLRPFDERRNCHKLQQLLEIIARKEGESYCLLRYYDSPLDPMFGGNKTETRTLREVLIDEFVNKEKFCLVIAAKGRSRMGDSYPPSCRCYMDLVENSVCWDSIIQSIGRAQGPNKKSICYLRRSYMEPLLKWIENGCYDVSKRFGPRTQYIDERGEKIVRPRGRPSKQICIVFPNASEI